MNNFLTIKDASKILGVSKMTLRNWDNSGKLKAYRHPLNNYRMYRVDDIEKIIELIETSPIVIQRKKDEVRKLHIEHLD